MLSGASNMLMLTGPLFMMQIYDRVLASRSIPTLVALSVLVIALYAFLGIIEVVRARILARIGHRLEEQLGDTTFEAVLTLPLVGASSGKASQPMRDLDQLRQFMAGQGPIAICDMPWLPIYLTIIFLFHSYLGWLASAGAAALFVVTITSEIALRKPTRELSSIQIARGQMIEAGTRNAEALRAMGMTDNYAQRWRATNEAYLGGQARAADTVAGFAAVTKVMRLALQSAILGLGAWLAIFQEISPGAMIAASILTSRALAPIELAVGQWKGFVSARQSYGNLARLLAEPELPPQPMELPAPKQRLQVDQLAVGAPGSMLLIVQGVSFDLAAGEGLGIIGPSGSGKSTLLRGLTGIWPPRNGSVRLDGAELGQWSSSQLGKSIGYLPQGVELFDGTVASNISRFASGADPAWIVEAAQLADVHDLILSLPEGYDTEIGTGGEVLSAGQRQRVGLARALYGNPFLVVLDEPNANLDAEGEAALTRAISAMRKLGSVVIVVAHRPSALRALDRVLVLNGGRQVAFGPRDEVLRRATRQNSSTDKVA